MATWEAFCRYATSRMKPPSCLLKIAVQWLQGLAVEVQYPWYMDSFVSGNVVWYWGSCSRYSLVAILGSLATAASLGEMASMYVFFFFLPPLIAFTEFY